MPCLPQRYVHRLEKHISLENTENSKIIQCAYGYGTTCGTKTGKKCKSSIPPALQGDCRRCRRKGCVSCDTVDSKCDYCKGGYASVPDASCTPWEPCFLNECIPCEDPNCGVCSEDPKICEAYSLRCNNTNAPIQPAINAQAKQWEGSVAINRLGYDGTGYTRYYHAWIKNKTCMDCFRGIWTAGTSFFPESFTEEGFACDLYQKALKVAANAWVRVPCKNDVKYELFGWLFGPVSNSPFADKSVTINLYHRQGHGQKENRFRRWILCEQSSRKGSTRAAL